MLATFSFLFAIICQQTLVLCVVSKTQLSTVQIKLDGRLMVPPTPRAIFVSNRQTVMIHTAFGTLSISNHLFKWSAA